MKLTISQQALSAALSTVIPAVSTRSTVPVLNNLFLCAENGKLRISGTNLEIGLQAWCEAEIETPGTITVPARIFSDFIKQLPKESVALELSARTMTLRVYCNGYSANFKGIDGKDFPMVTAFDDVENGSRFELPEIKWLERVIFAASADERRPTLTGIELIVKHGEFTAAATDGYRLAIYKMPLDCEPFSLIVPSNSLRQLMRVNTVEPIRCVVPEERNRICFSIIPTNKHLTRVELTSQLIDARFPDYKAIIPKEHKSKTLVDVSLLKRAVQMAQLFARDSANIIRLCFAGEKLTILAQSSNLGDSQTDLFVLNEKGNEPLEISFNSKYLLDMLNVVDGTLIVEMTESKRPGVFKIKGKDDNYMHVLMPMHPPK